MADADPGLQHLSEAVVALGERRDDEALASLLLAWRHFRSPALVPVVEALSGVLARARGPIGGKTPAERAERWRALSRGRDPADLGRLLTSATEPSSLDECAARLKAIAGWPDDPRTVSTARHLHRKVGYSIHGAGQKVWKEVFALLAAVPDPRVLLELREPPKGTKGLNRGEIFMRRRVEALLTAQRAALPPALRAATKEQIAEHFQLPKEALPLLERACALVDTRLGDESAAVAARTALLDEIYQRPDDDAPRQRYADLLRQSGDPRGELIHIQLLRHRGDTDPGRKKRERELLRDHRDEWLGLVAKWVKGVAFERGFLAACTLVADSRTPAEALAAPEWRTVERLTFDKPDSRYFPRRVCALRETNLRYVGKDALRALVEARGPISLSSIHLALHAPMREIDEEQRRLVDKIRCLPHLRTLRLILTANHWRPGPEEVRWLWSTVLGQTIRVLEIPYWLAAWLADCAVHAPWLEELVKVEDDAGLFLKYRLRLGRGGEQSTLRLVQHSARGPHPEWWGGREVKTMFEVISALPEDALSEVVYLKPAKAPDLPAPVEEALRRALARQKHVERFEQGVLAEGDRDPQAG